MPRTQTHKGSAGRRTHATTSEIISLVFVMGRFMKEKMHKKVGSGQCSLLEFEALRYIKEANHPLMRDIAKAFHMTPPATTLLIDGLVKRSLLERLVNPLDRRSVRIGLTRKGKQTLERGMAHRIRELTKAFSVLTPAERSQFATIIRKITKHS